MIDTPLDRVAQLIRGAVEHELTGDSLSLLRLPAWTRLQQADRWIELWSAHSLGTRLVTQTAARRISLSMTVTRMVPAGAYAPPFPCSVVANVGGSEAQRIAIVDGPVILNRPDRTWLEVDGPRSFVEFDLGESDGEREVTIWFPHNGQAVLHSVMSDAQLAPPAPSTRPVWLHHGSSVSHCLEAESPLSTWPQMVARSLELELTNLAIAGNAQLDPFVARTIAQQPADVITLKLGVNIINADSMRRRAFVPALHGFLDIVRAGHPTTPILVLSPIVSPAIEDIPGPTSKHPDGLFRGTPRTIVEGDGTLTLSIVRALVKDAVESRSRSDPLLWFGDGLDLLGHSDVQHLWDGLHPDQEGYDLIAERFVAHARAPATPFAAAFDKVIARPHP